MCVTKEIKCNAKAHSRVPAGTARRTIDELGVTGRVPPAHSEDGGNQVRCDSPSHKYIGTVVTRCTVNMLDNKGKGVLPNQREDSLQCLEGISFDANAFSWVTPDAPSMRWKLKGKVPSAPKAAPNLPCDHVASLLSDKAALSLTKVRSPSTSHCAPAVHQ